MHDPTSQAGITCTACHAINHINSTRGNADYTIDEPIHYPFAFSTNRFLQYINQQLVKGKPEFHKQTFMKPFMRTAEFCSTCHKVSIPGDLNHYKDFLRGQDHYDAWLLSGVSGHGARSFYYPPTAVQNCAGCHMPLQASDDFGANFFNPTNPSTRYIHNHLFPAANTGVPYLRGDTNAIRAQEEFLKGSLRVDIFGIKEDGSIDDPLTAPLRPRVPALRRGHRYLIEVVLRTMKVGHVFTQGTADSNEIWVDSKVKSGGRIIGRNGGLGPHKEVDPWSHLVNLYMLDRKGNRVDRRNVQDIFTPLYNHQIPPGAGQVVHYDFVVPENQSEPITLEVKLQYRKFDTLYMNYVFDTNFVKGGPFTVTNNLPITTIASDKITFPVEGVDASAAQLAAIATQTSNIPVWQRWNDYGIGLLLEGDVGAEKGELIQATASVRAGGETGPCRWPGESGARLFQGRPAG